MVSHKIPQCIISHNRSLKIIYRNDQHKMYYELVCEVNYGKCNEYRNKSGPDDFGFPAPCSPDQVLQGHVLHIPVGCGLPQTLLLIYLVNEVIISSELQLLKKSTR